MKRERRYCTCKALDREIMIGYPPAGFIRARARDVSLGGMWVETAAPLPSNRPLELLIRTSANGADETHRWRATVRHSSPNGIGLMYQPFDAAELPVLLGLLRDATAVSVVSGWPRQDGWMSRRKP